MKLVITYMLIFMTTFLTAQSVEDELELNMVDFLHREPAISVITDSTMTEQVKIYSNGEFRASFDADSGAYLQEADKHHKKDIRELKERTLQKVLQLEPISYLMKNQRNRGRSIGLVAQDVKKIYPSLVKHIHGEEVLTISYIELIPILVKAIQEQQSTIQNLKNNQYTMQKEFAVFRLQMEQLAKSLTEDEIAFRNDAATVAQNQN